MEIPMHIGLDKTKVDSILLVWPDNTYQTIFKSTKYFKVSIIKKGLPKFDYTKLKTIAKIQQGKWMILQKM